MNFHINISIFVGAKIQEELERQLFNLQRRVLRDRSNPFEIPEELFKGLYRLPKRIAMNLINELEPLMVGSLRITSMPNHLKVLCAWKLPEKCRVKFFIRNFVLRNKINHIVHLLVGSFFLLVQ